jgi:hypothetical protein
MYSLLATGDLNNSSTAASNATSDKTGLLATGALAFWQNYSTINNVPFTTPLGKFSIPFPMGNTLEQLASIYLNDATRWTEIAALNGLQAPYIDENGFLYSFLNDGSQNEFNVSSAVNLYVGQPIVISSNSQFSSARKILRISQITTTNFLIIVDGPSDLANFTTVDNAQLQAHLPYTVNSMSKIFIPSATPSTQDDLNTKILTFIDEDINLVKFSRIDWLLTPSGDLAVTQNGFQNLAFGKTNLIQAATLKMITPPGGLQLHPEYGAAPQVGDSFADFNAQAEVVRMSNAFASDSRFNAPSSISITLGSGAAVVNLVASVSQGNGVLPITIPLSKS